MDKLKIVNKIKSIATIVLFVSIFFELFFPIFKYVTMISSCLIYIGVLISNKLRKGKLDLVLLLLCSLSLAWVFMRGLMTSPYTNVLGLVVAYSFLTWSFKSNTGKWNKDVILYGSLAVICSIGNIYLQSKLLSWGIFGLQLVIIFKFLDPILEEIGQKKRQKRLAYEAEQKRLREEAGQTVEDTPEGSSEKSSMSAILLGKSVAGVSKPGEIPEDSVIIETEGSEIRHG